MRVHTIPLYASSNGDRWLLARDADTEEVFVQHEPNQSSGGRPTKFGIATFLNGGRGHEQQALVKLIGSLVEDH
jgi:hypothetical protein